MKVLGLDFGDKTCGIAISDREGKLARGLTTLRFQRGEEVKTAKAIADLAKREGASHIALGYPKNMDGTVGVQGQKTERFKTHLEASGLTVSLVDERLSTQLASMHAIDSNLNTRKRKRTIDEGAAIVILQSYLDATKKEER